MREVVIGPGFGDWQAAARELLRENVPPVEVSFRQDVAGRRGTVIEGSESGVRVPRRFVELARAVAPHRDPVRWGLLYSVLWRLVHENRELLESGDPDVARLLALQTAVIEGRDVIGAGPFLPSGGGLGDLVAAAARCTGCDLYRHASRTVFGKGPADARVVLVGEQPGDQEDRQGAPFVGPAGEVFDRALVEVGLARERLYVTNAVKRRIHQTPAAADIAACRPWVEAELTLIEPEMLVCLGATASRALLGPAFRLMRDHGRFIETPWARKTIATLHPSAVLRGEDEAAQGRLYAMLRDDLRLVSQHLSA